MQFKVNIRCCWKKKPFATFTSVPYSSFSRVFTFDFADTRSAWIHPKLRFSNDGSFVSTCCLLQDRY